VTACALSWPAAVVLSVAAVCLTVLLVAVVVVSTMIAVLPGLDDEDVVQVL
jgi:hypothetical protein